MQKVFKVVYVRHQGQPDEQLLSAWMQVPSLGNEDKMGLIYPPNVFVRPRIKGSYIMAFERQDCAQYWIERTSLGSRSQIWEAVARRVLPPHPTSFFYSTHGDIPIQEARQFWNDFRARNLQNQTRNQPIPWGTLLCTSLKLIKKVS